MDTFVKRVEDHGVLQHPIFQKMAASRLTVGELGFFFCQMGRFCSASRPSYDLPQTLRAHGYRREADLVQAIAESEAMHRESFNVMAKHLLQQNETVGRFMAEIEDAKELEERIRALSARHIARVTPNRVTLTPGILPETEAACEGFEFRKQHGLIHMAQAVGVGIAIEAIAHRHIIPGEVRAFVESGFYGVTLDMPEMKYLREHHGKDGAEAMHEEFMRLISEGPIKARAPLVNRGIRLMCDKTVAWYDALMAHIE